MVKTITKICNALTILILICALTIVDVLLIPRLADYETSVVPSGSMGPYYHVGSVIFVDKPTTPEEIRVDDPIILTKIDALVAIHRVADVDSDKREFRTKGDANATENAPPVSPDMLVGKAGMSIPLLGYISIYMKTLEGTFGIAAIFIVTILPQLIPESVEPERKEES